MGDGGFYNSCIFLEAASLLKIHKKLGHASAATISRVCIRAGKSISEELMLQTTRDCVFGRTESAPQVPRINRYQGTFMRDTVFSDVISPDSHRHGKPAILFVCAFSRFCIARFLSPMRPLSAIAVLLEVWDATMWIPSSLIVDSGRTFMGPEWKQVCDMFDMRIVTYPPRAHFQCGRAERHGAWISRSFEAMKRSPIFPADFPRSSLIGLCMHGRKSYPAESMPDCSVYVSYWACGFLGKLRNARTPRETELRDCPSTRS